MTTADQYTYKSTSSITQHSSGSSKTEIINNLAKSTGNTSLLNDLDKMSDEDQNELENRLTLQYIRKYVYKGDIEGGGNTKQEEKVVEYKQEVDKGKENEEDKRKAIETGATDAITYATDSSINDIVKAVGKEVKSVIGTVASGIITAFDINDTINNNNYTTGQKIEKAAIQVVGGAVDVAGAEVIVGAAALVGPETGFSSIVAAVTGVSLWGYGVSRVQNWLYRKLGL